MAINKVILNGVTEVDLSGDTAVASDVLVGKTFHLSDGTSAVGEAEAKKPEQEKTATPTKSSQDIEPDDGYTLSKVIVGAIPNEYIVPTGIITITDNGTIDVTQYASAKVTARKSEQTKTATPTKETQNITPDSGYTLSQVTVEAIPDSYIIPTGTISIGENGSYDITQYANATVSISGGGGEEWTGMDLSYFCANRSTITEYIDSEGEVKLIKDCAFYGCISLTTISFLNCQYIGNSAFYACQNLSTISIPNCAYIGSSAFYGCSKLNTLYINNYSGVCYLPYEAISSITGSIYVHPEWVNAYCHDSIWGQFELHIVGSQYSN